MTIPEPSAPPSAWQRDLPPLVLASASRPRRMLLEAAGLRFSVQASGIAEDAIKRTTRENGGTASEAALALSAEKARVVSAFRPNALVLGADQILTCADVWYDKPVDMDEAERHLRRLRGRSQVLHTAVTLMRGGEIAWQHVALPTLRMRDFSDALLALYLQAEGCAALASVGACRIEGPGQMLFEEIEGEHAAILGLPMMALLAALRRLGVLAV